MGVILIEIGPLGLMRVAVSQPSDPSQGERLWRLYRRLRPQIVSLEQAAREEGPRVALPATEGHP